MLKLPSDVHRLIADELDFLSIARMKMSCRGFAASLGETYFKRKALHLGFPELLKPRDRSWAWCCRSRLPGVRLGFIRNEDWEYGGELLNSRPHGFGVQRWSEGSWKSYHAGTFFEGRKEGFGESLESTPRVTMISRGNYINNRKAGIWTSKWIECEDGVGNTTEVSFDDGAATHGVYHCKTEGKTFFGPLTRGRFYTYGKMTWNDGSSYVGQFKPNSEIIMRHGYGQMTMSDGRVRTGQWADDKPCAKDGTLEPDEPWSPAIKAQ